MTPPHPRPDAPSPGERPAADPAPQAFGPLVGPVFWLLILVSLACIAAGALIGLAGPSLFPARRAPALHIVGSWQAAPRPLTSAARPG